MTPGPADLLRRHGIQVTAQRLAVLRAVSGRPHITADGVAEVAEVEIGAISRQAVYDALGVLVEKGLVRRIQPVGSPALYEDRVDDNHHHLICRTCGRVADVDCAVGFTPCLAAPPTTWATRSTRPRSSTGAVVHSASLKVEHRLASIHRRTDVRSQRRTATQES